MIYIPKNEEFISFIRGFNYLKWEKESRAWSVPNYSDNLDKILAFLDGQNIQIIHKDTVSEAKTTQLNGKIKGIKTAKGRIK